MRLPAALAIAALLTALPGVARAQAIINTSRSNIKGIVLQLNSTKDTTDVLAVEGGQPVADVTVFNTAPFQKVRQLGKPKFEDIRIEVSAQVGASLADWIRESLAGRGRTRTGHILLMDDRRDVVAQIEFADALLTEVGLPALDAASKDAAKITVVFSPGKVVVTGAGAAAAVGTRYEVKGRPQKQWLPANFRVRVDDFNGGAPVRGRKGLNAVNVKQARMAGSPAQYALDPPMKANTPDLEFTSADGRFHTDPYVEDVQRTLQGIETPRVVSVDYLNEDGDLLLTLTEEVIIYKVTRELGAGVPMVRLSMIRGGAPVTITWP